MTVEAEFGWTWTTPVREVGGTGWVGSLATAAMWLARPSVRPAVESDLTAVAGLLEALLLLLSWVASRDGWAAADCGGCCCCCCGCSYWSEAKGLASAFERLCWDDGEAVWFRT